MYKKKVKHGRWCTVQAFAFDFFLDLLEILFKNLRRSTLVADCFCCCDIYIINDVVASSAFIE